MNESKVVKGGTRNGRGLRWRTDLSAEAGRGKCILKGNRAQANPSLSRLSPGHLGSGREIRLPRSNTRNDDAALRLDQGRKRGETEIGERGECFAALERCGVGCSDCRICSAACMASARRFPERVALEL